MGVKFRVPLIFLVFISGVAAAETQPPAFEFSGYLDAYFQNSSEAHDPTSPTTGPAFLEGRAFDAHSNEMTVNMVELSAKRKVNEVTFRADLAFGHMVDVLAGSGTLSNGQPAAANSQEPTRNITQAFIAYNPSALSNLTVTVGKFYTHMGYEVARAKDNWQYSRSLNFNYAIPFWHEGLSVNYGILPGRFAATAFVLNGWDGRISSETNKSSTVGLNLNFTPIEGLAANYNYIGGLETTRDGREVHELNASYAVSQKLAFAADYVIGSQEKAVNGNAEDANWSALAVYVKYSPVTWYTLSPRYEIFDDADGFALSTHSNTPPTKHKITALTVANNFTLQEGLEARLEYRSDVSSHEGYFKDSDGSFVDKQSSYTIALLYSF